MTIKEFIVDLVSQGKTEEEILKILEKGDAKKGITPKKPPFNKLILKRTMASVNESKKVDKNKSKK